MVEIAETGLKKESPQESASQTAQGLSVRAVFSCTLFTLFINWPLLSIVFEAPPRYAYLILFCYWFLAIVLTMLVVRFQIARNGFYNNKDSGTP